MRNYYRVTTKLTILAFVLYWVFRLGMYVGDVNYPLPNIPSNNAMSSEFASLVVFSSISQPCIRASHNCSSVIASDNNRDCKTVNFRTLSNPPNLRANFANAFFVLPGSGGSSFSCFSSSFGQLIDQKKVYNFFDLVSPELL